LYALGARFAFPSFAAFNNLEKNIITNIDRHSQVLAVAVFLADLVVASTPHVLSFLS
jgi:hypothetical protein